MEIEKSATIKIWIRKVCERKITEKNYLRLKIPMSVLIVDLFYLRKMLSFLVGILNIH